MWGRDKLSRAAKEMPSFLSTPPPASRSLPVVPVVATCNAPRRAAYRRREVVEIFGASLSTVDKAIREGRIRVKREVRT